MKKHCKYENVPCTVASIDFLRVSRGRNFRCRYTDGRPKNGFIFVESGRLRLEFPQNEGAPVWTLSAGESVFLPKGTVYISTYLESETSILVAQFDTVGGSLPRSLSSPVRVPSFGLDRELTALIDAPVSPNEAQLLSLRSASIVYALLWRAAESLSDTKPKFRKLTPALTRIRRYPASPDKVAFYAELCGMSETGFRRLFSEYTGLSPVEYRNRLRLEEADKLLRTGEYLVEEAAIEVGFSNVSFFCRLYKRRFGHTPLGKA